MENCILGEGTALFEKIAAVVDNPALYQVIRQNGFDLVHRGYTRRHWRGILDFYEQSKTLKSDRMLQQQGVLGPFVPVEAGNDVPALEASYSDSTVSALLKLWLAEILDEGILAKRDTGAFPDWVPHMEEPFVLLGIKVLLKGDASQARELFLAPRKFRLEKAGCADYDPEEIAWLSLIAALTGDAELVALTRREGATMRHLSLRRMHWLAEIYASKADSSQPPANTLRRAATDRLSVHLTGQLPLDRWCRLIDRVLSANGQIASFSKAPLMD